MTQMRLFPLALTAAVMALAALPAGAQTIIGDDSPPRVEVNLDVLPGLVSATGGSVLLLEPVSGSGGNLAATTTGSTVLLLDEPAIVPAATGDAFVFPEVPEDKPAAPAAEIVTATTETTTTTTVVTMEPVADVAPEPEVMTETSVPDEVTEKPEGGGKTSDAALVQAVAEANVRIGVDRLVRDSVVLRGRVASGDLMIVGAMHDIATGVVTVM